MEEFTKEDYAAYPDAKVLPGQWPFIAAPSCITFEDETGKYECAAVVILDGDGLTAQLYDDDGELLGVWRLLNKDLHCAADPQKCMFVLQALVASLPDDEFDVSEFESLGMVRFM